jgi:hypothetical protein
LTARHRVCAELARKFHDNAVRCRPEERPERSAFLTPRGSRISPRC